MTLVHNTVPSFMLIPTSTLPAPPEIVAATIASARGRLTTTTAVAHISRVELEIVFEYCWAPLLDCKRVTIIDAFGRSMLLTSNTAGTTSTNATATGDTAEFDDEEGSTCENRHHCRVVVEAMVVFLTSMRAM
jgi:hypothetical protein